MSNLPPAPGMAPEGIEAPFAPSVSPVPSVQNAQNTQRPVSNNVYVGKVNYTSKQLFEVSGVVDKNKRFPEPIAFVTFIPGVPDNTKATGITYNQQAKETMKIAIRDLYAMAEAIMMAANGIAPDFVLYTDSSKSNFNNGNGITKQISVGSGEYRGKPRVYLNYKGQGQIQLSLDKFHAIGVAKQLQALCDATLNKKFEEERNYSREG